MAVQRHTCERAWTTRLTNLATATTLAGAAQHEFTDANGATMTLQLPEGSLSFKSVHVEVTARDAMATARPLIGVRIGINLGAVGYNDEDHTLSLGVTGDHELYKFRRDVTSYFQTNWTGSSMACSVRVRFSHQTDAQNVNNITCKIIYTYEYDGGTTRSKTIRIPIMSHHTFLGTSAVEVGTTGGTNNAAANQIPNLSNYLVEDGVTIDGAWLEIEACENAGATTTDHTMTVTIDATTYTRATIEQGLATGCYYFDILDYNTSTHGTSAAHSFSAHADVDQRYLFTGAVLYITYRYTESSTTRVCNSLYIPATMDRLPNQLPGTTSADALRILLEFDLEEPGTITTLQSAIRCYFAPPGSSNTPAIHVLAGGQADRTYTVVTGIKQGEIPFIHRTDHGTSPWAFARGRNRLYWTVWANGNTQGKLNQAFYIINYTSDKSLSGSGAHNQSCAWMLSQYDLVGVSQFYEWTANVRTPTVASHYYLNSIALCIMLRRSTTGASGSISAEIKTGEYDGDGWWSGLYTTENPGETGTVHTGWDLLPYFKRNDQDPNAFLAIGTSRKYRFNGSDPVSVSGMLWTTHHENKFQVTGTVTGYPSGDGSGITVKLWNATRNQKVAEAVTAVGGGYSINCYDNVDSYFTEARVSATAVSRSDNITPTAIA